MKRLGFLFCFSLVKCWLSFSDSGIRRSPAGGVAGPRLALLWVGLVQMISSGTFQPNSSSSSVHRLPMGLLDEGASSPAPGCCWSSWVMVAVSRRVVGQPSRGGWLHLLGMVGRLVGSDTSGRRKARGPCNCQLILNQGLQVSGEGLWLVHLCGSMCTYYLLQVLSWRLCRRLEKRLRKLKLHTAHWEGWCAVRVGPLNQGRLKSGPWGQQ